MLGVDYVAKCINDCDRRGGRMLEKMPVDAAREVRASFSCKIRCAPHLALLGNSYADCIEDCEGPEGYRIDPPKFYLGSLGEEK